MSRTRPSRAAARTLRLLLLASLVMLGPLAAAPSHAWTPPPAPLPMEPGDTDGQIYDFPDRPGAPTHSMTRSAERRAVAEEAEVGASPASLSELMARILRLFEAVNFAPGQGSRGVPPIAR